MSTLAKPIAESLKFTDFIMRLVMSDLTDEVARRRSRGNEGASIAWVIGHLTYYRHEILKLLGHEGPNPLGKQFADGATDGRDYPEIERLKAVWVETSAKVLPVLAGASDEQLLESKGSPDSPHGEKKVLDTLVFFMWHESYHMGQLGTLRTQFGLTPTATLAVEASNTAASSSRSRS